MKIRWARFQMDENANLFCMGGCTKTNHTRLYTDSKMGGYSSSLYTKGPRISPT